MMSRDKRIYYSNDVYTLCKVHDLAILGVFLTRECIALQIKDTHANT